LAAAGVARETFADPDARVPCTAYGALIESAQRRQPRPNLALRMAEVTPIGAYPLVDYLVVSSPTVGDGLRRLSRYYRLDGAPNPMVLHDAEDPIRVTLEGGPGTFAIEYVVALTLLHLRRESGGEALAECACFTHRPDDPAELSKVFGCEVRTGAPWNGFILSRRTWNLPMRRRDPALLALLERHAEARAAGDPDDETVSRRVRGALESGLARGEASLAAVARTLAMTPRTIQRRLAGEGATFNALLDAVRREAAERHLRGSVLSIAEIAFVLDFSEPAAFHRAFRRWHRVTPQAYRAGRRAR
jgi:AraC-like DNA-binding protein